MAAPAGRCEFCGLEMQWTTFPGDPDLWVSCPAGCGDFFGMTDAEREVREDGDGRTAGIPIR